MTMKKLCLLVCLLAASLSGQAARKNIVLPSGGKAISDELLGIFFEDISSSADGGLYAELLQNGSFEYNPTERDGWGPGTAWRMIRPGHSLGHVEIRMDRPLHVNNPTYMRLHTERVGHYYDFDGWTGFGLENSGFDGINVRAGACYDFSVFLRNASEGLKQLRVALVVPQGWGKSPKLLAEANLTTYSDEWQKCETVLVPSESAANAVLQILVLTPGDLDIDFASLMPEDTYKGHGLRKDLALALAALQPKFMRFPGGCVVHGGGDGFWNTYRWKTTIGPRHERRALKNTWGYHQSMGLGYFEYFQFCEDLNMQPLPILPCGVSCQGTNGGWGMKGQAQDVVPMDKMDEWVEDALDLIDWANGDPATNKWAKMRADAGHPEPFNLKYLGLGNEEKITPEFEERFTYIYNKVREAHPEIIIVGTAGPGSHAGNPDYDNGWRIATELNVPILDEHYYEPRDYFLTSRQYDNYPRDRKTKVYLGEYAAKDKKLIDALAEGLYLMHVERNGDVVCMTSYAPLFARKGATNWNPDLIYFDNERPYLTCSYFVQQLFGRSAGQHYYGDCVTIEGATDKQAQSVVVNTKTGQLFVKIVNASADMKNATIDLSRFKGLGKQCDETTVGAFDDSGILLPDASNIENNYEAQPVAPRHRTRTVGKRFTHLIQPYTMTMFEFSFK